MRLYTLLLASCVGLASAGASYAADDTTSNTVPTGPYVEANVGYSHVDSGFPDEASHQYGHIGGYAADTVKKGGIGYNLNAGYQFNQQLGLEAGITSYAPQDVEMKEFIGHGGGGSTTLAEASTNRAYMYDVAGKLTFPLSNKFDVFAKAGPAMMSRSLSYTSNSASVDYKERAVGVAYGVGMDYNFTQHIALTAQANGASPIFQSSSESEPNMPSVFLISTGLKYTF
ncbi:MAG: hypothetical protein K0R12_710 [Gammaproteobacteria bacterium]|nr:hypothetical protein [Gammaproteobacteria bacterium]